MRENELKKSFPSKMKLNGIVWPQKMHTKWGYNNGFNQK